MATRNVDDMLDRFADGLKPNETIAMLRPQVRDRIQEFALRKGWWRSRWALWAFIGTGASAAAAVLVVMLAPHHLELTMTVAVSGSEDDLFLRDATSGNVQDAFWVGVNVDTPCWIHLVERTAKGDLIVMRPQESSDAYSVRAENRIRMGPFHLAEPGAPGGPADVSHLIVIASSRPISGDALAASIPDVLAAGGAEAAVEAATGSLAETLASENGWAVTLARIPVTSNER